MILFLALFFKSVVKGVSHGSLPQPCGCHIIDAIKIIMRISQSQVLSLFSEAPIPSTLEVKPEGVLQINLILQWERKKTPVP